MIIVCSTDDNFVQHCVIMLVSLLHNNSDSKVKIYILTESLSKKNKEIINEEVTNKGGTIEYCMINGEIISKFPMPKLKQLDHISRATYYRLLIPELLPKSIEKVLYLDCDMIVNSSLKELWNTDINGYALGASKQIGSGCEAKRLGIPIQFGYFNAGMALLNLDYMRRNSISSKLIQYLIKNSDKIKFHDQDALNAVLYDKYIPLLPQWNMTSFVYSFKLKRRGDSCNGKVINEYIEEKKNVLIHLKTPCILHYVSRPKPWQRGCIHPLYNLYYDYSKLTINFNHIKPQPYLIRSFFIVKHKIREYLSYIKQKIHKTDQTLL